MGFALETGGGAGRARRKLAAKGVDLMVLNTPEAGLGGDTNRATLVERRRTRALPTMTKHDVADAIFERVLELRTIAKMRAVAAAEAKQPRVRRVPRPRRSQKRAKS